MNDHSDIFKLVQLELTEEELRVQKEELIKAIDVRTEDFFNEAADKFAMMIDVMEKLGYL